MPGRLELTGHAFTSRSVNFMTLMGSPDFTKAFEADPAGIAMQEFQLHLPAKTISASNKLLAFLLNSPEFNQWAQEFQKQIEQKLPKLSAAATVSELADQANMHSQTILQDFAQGMAEHLPEDIQAKLKIGAAWKGQITAEDDIAIVLLVFVAVLVVVVAPMSRDELLSRNTVRLLVNQLNVLRTKIQQDHPGQPG